MEILSTFARRVPVEWWNVLDILIVSVAIYEGLKLIRGTRAVQMGIALAFIVGLYRISQVAPLPTVNWVITNMVTYVVFAAIVIFQSDIRRALAHFGRARLFSRFSGSEAVDDLIEEVVVAATTLADRRTGAIMVIERGIGLRNYIESGVPVDAELTHDLLVSVFQRTSPLHDGAVILQEGRLAAASCFLPLTVNPSLSRELGTRHRAAIGLTEENDALAIIVSEETGKISLALDGRIERALGAESLRSRLKALLTDKRAGGAADLARGRR